MIKIPQTEMCEMEGREVIVMPFWIRHFIRYVGKTALGWLIQWVNEYGTGDKANDIGVPYWRQHFNEFFLKRFLGLVVNWVDKFVLGKN